LKGAAATRRRREVRGRIKKERVNGSVCGSRNGSRFFVSAKKRKQIDLRRILRRMREAKETVQWRTLERTTPARPSRSTAVHLSPQSGRLGEVRLQLLRESLRIRMAVADTSRPDGHGKPSESDPVLPSRQPVNVPADFPQRKKPLNRSRDQKVRAADSAKGDLWRRTTRSSRRSRASRFNLR
jgi:hypothetical protein